MKKLVTCFLAVIMFVFPSFIISAESQALNSFENESYKNTGDNQKFSLYVDKSTGFFEVKSISSGKVWSSVPSNLETVEMKNAKKNLVRSSLILEIFNTEEKTLSINANSKTDATVSVNEGKSKSKIIYFFEEYGITVPLEICITDSGFSATVNTASIKETNKKFCLINIRLLPFFNAGYYEERGFMLVPDGSGAVINFGNGKGDGSSYSQQVYGRDYGASLQYKNTVEQPVPAGYFGIAHPDSYSIALITNGAAEAYVDAVGNQSNNHYNYCYAKFNVRKGDFFRNSGEWLDVPIYQEKIIDDTILQVSYILKEADIPDYSDMADTFRNYLIENKYISEGKTESPFQVDLLGATVKKKSFLGIPVNRIQKLTEFKDAENIISDLTDSGVENALVRYIKWNSATVWGKVSASSNLSLLGGKKSFNNFKDAVKKSGSTLYLEANPIYVYKGKSFLSYFTDFSQSVFNESIKQFSYKINTSAEDTFFRHAYLLKKDLICEISNHWDKAVRKTGADGLSFGGTNILYTDFRNSAASRTDTQNEFKKAESNISCGVMVDSGYLYTLNNISFISDMPAASSGFDIEDDSVPFYQMLLHGTVGYSLEAINVSADYQSLFLRSVETGAMLRFKFTSAGAGDIKNSEDSALISGNYLKWRDTVKNMYKAYEPVYRKISSAKIINHLRLTDNVFKTEYDNGISVTVNYSDNEYNFDGITVPARDFRMKEEVAKS